METMQLHETTAAQPGLADGSAAQLCAAQQGQPGAFDAVMAAYETRVMRQCQRRGLSTDEAADVTQDVFLKAYRWMDRYEHQNAFSTWLYRITENACIDYCRKRSRRQSVMQPIPVGADGHEHEYAGAGRDPEAMLEAGEVSDQIHAAIAALAPILREAFLLKEQQGLRYEQIATELGCSLGTVKSRIYRARQELMERLGHLR